MTVLFAKRLVRAGQERRFHIHYEPGTGWETARAGGSPSSESKWHTDWHRVERVLTGFSAEIADLLRQGWREAETAG